jgi:hypothetical protein
MILLLMALGTGLIPLASEAQSTRPALHAFSNEVQQLYRDAQRHLVRVQVPVRVPYDHPLIKWRTQLDPALLERLDAARARGQSPGLYLEPSPIHRSSPATTQSGADGQPARIPLPPATAVIKLECAGLILDGQGDVLVPVFIDKNNISAPMQVRIDPAQATTASLVASDRQTSLSVLRMTTPAGEPVQFAQASPAAGSVVLLIATTHVAARLQIWTGGEDESAIVVNPEGNFAGVVRNGHAMFPAMVRPVVDQLLKYGTVRRARLGVQIKDAPVEESARVKIPLPRARTAVRVETVEADSAASAGGIQAGDLIISVAGEPVEDVPTFSAAVAGRRGNTELIILRDGKQLSISVDLQP